MRRWGLWCQAWDERRRLQREQSDAIAIMTLEHAQRVAMQGQNIINAQNMMAMQTQRSMHEQRMAAMSNASQGASASMWVIR